MNPRVIAQRGTRVFLLEEADGSTAVLDIEGPPALFPARSADSVLSHGYWTEVTADPVRVRELAFRVAREGQEVRVSGFAPAGSRRELLHVQVDPHDLQQEPRQVRAAPGLTLLVTLGLETFTAYPGQAPSIWVTAVEGGPVKAPRFVGSADIDLTEAVGAQPLPPAVDFAPSSGRVEAAPLTAPAR